MKNNFDLTEREAGVMHELWNADHPLTTPEILEKRTDLYKYPAQLHNAVNSLLKKELIKVVGVVISGKKNARQFSAAVTEEDFAAQKARKEYGKSKALSKVAMALVKEATSRERDDNAENEKFIEELEDYIKRYRENNS